MDEDRYHQAHAGRCRFLLSIYTSEANVANLWARRETFDAHLRTHWSAIDLDVSPVVRQVRSDDTDTDLRERYTAIFDDALACSVLVLYTRRRIVLFLDHSVVSGHLGCRIVSWMDAQTWKDTIGLPCPGTRAEVAAVGVGACRVWSVPILRSYWLKGRRECLPPTGPPSIPCRYAIRFDVQPETHPQMVMHEILARVTEGWRSLDGRRESWSVCSAIPFKEIPGVANNVGVINYTFPIEPSCSARRFRDSLRASGWQVLLSAAANRALSRAGAGACGSLMSRLLPDVDVGREMIDALFSFISTKLSTIEAVHFYSLNREGGDSFSSPRETIYSRLKAFISAAYDKSTGRVQLILSVNIHAEHLPDHERLLATGFETVECMGPFLHV